MERFAKTMNYFRKIFHSQINDIVLNTRLCRGLSLSKTRQKFEVAGVRDRQSQLYVLCKIIDYIGLLPIKLSGWYDTPLEHCMSDIATRNLHFASQSTTAPQPRKYLIFNCVFLPIPSLWFFSNSTPRRICMIHRPAQHNLYPTYSTQIWL